MKESVLRDQNFWNFSFAAIFAALLFFAAYDVYDSFSPFLESIPLFHFVLISLAVFRLIRLFSYDKITDFARQWFLDKRAYVENGETHVELVLPESGVRRTITELLACPWCTGVWIALFVLYFYFVIPGFFYVILLLAVAGVASLLQLFANFIGWSAELRKTETEHLRGE